MGRSGRTLLIIAVMGLVSVVTLMWLAERYNKVLAKGATQRVARPAPAAPNAVATLTIPTPPGSAANSANPASPDERAQAYVDAFLSVRISMRAALEAAAAESPAERLTALALVRDRVLIERDLDLAEYRQVRALWRGWREKRQAPTAAFERAFTARADDIEAAHLGAMEAYD